MTSRQHSPLVIVEGPNSRLLAPLPMRSASRSAGYNEAWIRDLIFANPLSIPVHEIDPAFGPLIPICKELGAQAAGSADALFLNPIGMPTLVECKLWRNPEARREVVGQILDYARVLRRWTYADLQREAARARKEQGFNLIEFVRRQIDLADFDEAAFCDNVSRNLARSRILLLIIGDGIREGVEAIAEYVQGSPGLHFTLGLVEAQIYEIGPDQRIIQPRVLARTAIINRMIVDFANPTSDIEDSEQNVGEQSTAHNREPNEWQRYLLEFWTELLANLKLDDVDQPIPKPNATSNLYFSLPIGAMWLTCYFWQREKKIGVFLGSRRTSALALEIGRRLEAERHEIDRELADVGLHIRWEHGEGGKTEPAISKQFPDLRDPANRMDQLHWFSHTINAFVNVLRPRISRIMESEINPELSG